MYCLDQMLVVANSFEVAPLESCILKLEHIFYAIKGKSITGNILLRLTVECLHYQET